MALGLPDDPVKQRKILIGVIPLLLLGAYWYLLHGDYTREVEAMQTRLERLEERNAQARVRAPESQLLQERLEQFERHITRLEELVPRGEEVSQLLAQVSQQAGRVGVEVARFTPGRTEAGEHYNRRIFEMTVHGSYHDIGRFLSEIGSLPRIITPTALEIMTYRLGADADEGPLLEASFRIETYVLPEARSMRPETEATTGA